MLPVVHVGATDAGVGDGDEDGPGVGDGGDGALFIGDVEGGVEDEGEVLKGVRRGVRGAGGGIGAYAFSFGERSHLDGCCDFWRVFCGGRRNCVPRDSMQCYHNRSRVVPF